MGIEIQPTFVDEQTLREAYLREGSKDRVTYSVVEGTVDSLIEFGVNPRDVLAHLNRAADILKERIKEGIL